jgi:hypothetical protein
VDEDEARRALGISGRTIYIDRDLYSKFQGDVIQQQGQLVKEHIAAAPPLEPPAPPTPPWTPPASTPTSTVAPSLSPPPLGDLMASAGLTPPADSAVPEAPPSPPALGDLMQEAGLGVPAQYHLPDASSQPLIQGHYASVDQVPDSAPQWAGVPPQVSVDRGRADGQPAQPMPISNPLETVKQKVFDALDAFGSLLGGVTGPQPMTAAMQPTPSDTLTNPTLQTTPTDMSVSPPPRGGSLGDNLGVAGSYIGGGFGAIQNPNSDNPLANVAGTAASAFGTAAHGIGETGAAQAVGAGMRTISPMSSAARTVAGSDQWANEYAAKGGPALERELQALQGQRLAGDDSVMPRITEIGAQLNAINAEISGGKPTGEAMFDVAERNPNLPALETGANLAGAAIANPLAAEGMPVLARSLAEVLQPGSNIGAVLGKAHDLVSGPTFDAVAPAVEKAFADYGIRMADTAEGRAAQVAQLDDSGRNLLQKVSDYVQTPAFQDMLTSRQRAEGLVNPFGGRAEGSAVEEAATKAPGLPPSVGEISPPGVAHGLTINLPKYTPPEVRDVIQQAYDANPVRFDEARRGVIADQTVRELADVTGAKVNQIISRWKPGQAGNAETLLALRQGLANASADVLSQQRVLQQAAAPADQAAAMQRLLESITRHSAIQETVTGLTAEAGRALRQFSQPISGQEAALSQLQRIARANNVEPEAVATILKNADLSSPIEVAKLAQVLYQPSLRDKVLAWTTSNMLSGLKSLEINAVGNAIETINRPLVELSGGHWREAFDDVSAMGRAIGKAWGDASQTFLTGIRPSEVASAAAGKYDVRPQAFPGRGGIALTPALRIMSGTDEFFKVVNGAGGYAAEARRIARETGGTVQATMADPANAERLLDATQRAGDIPTYADEASPIAKMLLSGRRLIQEGAPLGPDAGKFWTGVAFNVLTPFVHIPDVIYRRGTAMLVEPIVGPTQAIRLALKGEHYAAQQRLGRAMQTTALLTAIYGEAAAGNITGDGPKDPDQRRALEAARDASGDPLWQRHSVRVGNRWIDYSNLGPASVPFAVIASAVEAYREDGSRPDANVAADTFDKTMKVLLDASYVKSIGDLFVAISSGSLDKAAASLLGNTLARAVPYGGAVAQMTRSTEPEIKQPRNPLEQVMARIPLTAGLVPGRVDPTTGQPMQAPQDIIAQLSPFKTSARGEPNAVAAEVARLEQGGFHVSVPSTSERMWGALQSGDQQRLIQEQYGTAVALYVSSAMQSPKYDRLTDQQKADALSQATSQAREAANVTLGGQVARDPHESALWQFATKPQYYGLSSKLPPEQVARMNWEIGQARAKLAAYNKQHGDAGEARLATEDKAAFNLTLKYEPVEREVLDELKARIDKATGGALTQKAAKASAGGLVGVGSTTLPAASAAAAQPGAVAPQQSLFASSALPTSPPRLAVAAPGSVIQGGAAAPGALLPQAPPRAQTTDQFRARQNADIRAAKDLFSTYISRFGQVEGEQRFRAEHPSEWVLAQQAEL